MPGEVVRTVVEGQCDMIAGNALGYTNASIRDVANQGALDVQGFGPKGLLICIATVAVAKLASWSRTIVITLPTVASISILPFSTSTQD